MTAAILYNSDDIDVTHHPHLIETTLELQHYKGKILILDDDAMMRQAFSNVLTCLEYMSICTCEGAETLRIYQQARDGENPFTGVILDLHNHLGKGGIETFVDLKQLDPNINAEICSGDTVAPEMHHYQRYGFRGALAKPFGLKDLALVLKCLC